MGRGSGSAVLVILLSLPQSGGGFDGAGREGNLVDGHPPHQVGVGGIDAVDFGPRHAVALSNVVHELAGVVVQCGANGEQDAQF